MSTVNCVIVSARVWTAHLKPIEGERYERVIVVAETVEDVLNAVKSKYPGRVTHSVNNWDDNIRSYGDAMSHDNHPVLVVMHERLDIDAAETRTLS